MKNLFKFMMAVAVLFTASCAKEDISSSIAGGEVEVSFTANLAGLSTRATYGTGSAVNTLRYEVYSNGAKLTELCGTTGIAVNVPCTVNLVLIKGMSYDILFWADNGSDIYSINNGVVSFSAQGINANDESRDAFYAVRQNFDPATATSDDTNVVLTRPFAQLNAIVPNMTEVGKSFDLNAQVAYIKSTIATTICTSFNPFTGEAGDETTVAVTFGETNVQDFAEGHLSMNYLLAPGHLSDVTFYFEGAKFATNTTIKNIPLKANYKTNVIGNLLTGATEFNVSIDANWNTAEHYIYEAFQNGGEVTLTENITIAETLVLQNGKDVVLDLNGYDITVGNDSDELGVGDAIIVTSGTLTIKGEGTVTANTRAVWARGNGNAVINIEGGHFVGATKDFACEVIYASGNGVINISGGTFEAVNEDTTSFAAPQYAILNLHGNGAAGCNIVVTGGSFKNFDPCDNVSENPKKNFCAAGYTAVQNGDWYEVGVDTTNYAYVENADGLKTALLGDKNILLAPNAVIEGTFAVNKNKTIMSLDPENKATIKGRVNVSSNEISNVYFENIKFEINDASKHKNTFSGAPYQYPAIVVAYGAPMSFEGCEFKCDIAKGVSGINAGNHADSTDVLKVNNCSFVGDFYAIRARSLFEVTNSNFDIYTNQGTLAAVWTWGNANSGANKVVFTGNTNLNANKIYSVQMTASNFVYDYVTINVQDNSNFLNLADGVNPARFNGTHTFAPGSETF